MMSYEESVHWLRSKPELAETVKACYLDADNKVAAERFTQSEEFAELVRLLHLKPGDGSSLDILDLGCGNGIVSYAFASLGHHVSSVDPDRSNDVGLDATERLRQTLPDPDLIKPAEGVAESLPYPDGSFDVIYTRQAVHHFRDLTRAFSECFRVLKPNGVLLATREHVVDNPEQLAVFLQEHALHHLHGGENAHPLDTYLGAIKGCGLRVEKIIAPFDNVINHFPSSNAEIRRMASTAFSKRVGATLGGLIASLPLVETLYRRLLSGRRGPGRLYSFLARKPA